MKSLWKVIIDWLDVNVQRKHKNSLLFLAMSFYLTIKGNMEQWAFVGVGLTTLGIYVVGNVVESLGQNVKNIDNSNVNKNDKKDEA
ncbi:MAG: hypothetical protein PHE51_10350 [Eubacteriales bacterium]|nr:hypothetical protein [Eubacteriales bacterium]